MLPSNPGMIVVPDNGYDVGHAEGRRRGQDDDLNGGHDDVQDVGADIGDSGWIHE